LGNLCDRQSDWPVIFFDWPDECNLSFSVLTQFKEEKAMFLYQILLFTGGFATTLFAITAVIPVPKNNPFSGF